MKKTSNKRIRQTCKQSLSILLALLMLLFAVPLAAGAVQAEEEPAAAAAPVEAPEKDPLNPLGIKMPELKLPRSAAPAKAPRRNGEAPAAIVFDWDEETKTLSFTGEGEMADYPLGGDHGMTITAPWGQYADRAERVVIGENITSVGAMDFALFLELKEVVFPTTLTKIGNYAFAYCAALEEANLPAGLTEIGEGAFVMNSLHTVVIPAGIEEISSNYSYNANKLSVTLPEGLKSVEDCFADCIIEELTIPASVESFRSESIMNTRRLVNNSSTAVVSDTLSSAVSDQAALLMLKIMTEQNLVYFQNNGQEPEMEDILAAYGKYLDLINEVFGTNFTTVNEFYAAAENNTIDLESVFNTIDYPMTGIEAYCLSESAEHDALHNLAVPHFLLDQDGAACTEPLIAKCGDNMTWAFDEATGVLTITGHGQMYDNYKAWFSVKDKVHAIRFVEDGGKITKIGQDAFFHFGTLDSVEIPSGVSDFTWQWLSGCTVGNFIIPAGFRYENLSYIYYAFGDADIGGVTVDPANEDYYVYEGGLYAKNGGDDTLAYYFGGSGAAMIKAGTVRINDYAFRSSKITSVTIPASVNAIGQNYPFEWCRNLKTVILEERMEPLAISAGTFNGCEALEAFVVSENDACFKAVNGVLYSKDMKTLYAVPATVTELVLPASVEGVSSFGGQAYYSNGIGLETLTVENASFNFGHYYENRTSAFCMARDTSAVTVTGYSNSTAEEFAMKGGFRFISLDGVNVESVVFDRSNVPATVTIGNQADFWNWRITGVVTYSDGTTKTIKYTDVSGNDFSIQYKYPGETGWRENNWISFDYLGDFEFRIVYGSFTEAFTITVQEMNYHYVFDTTDAITQVKQYGSAGDYMVSRSVQLDESSWTTVTDSILGVKLYKVYDDGETEQEQQNMQSYVSITYKEGGEHWGELVNEDLGVYTVTFVKKDRNSNPLATASIDVEVVAGDFTIECDFSDVPATVERFAELNTSNWGAKATVTITATGEQYDISDKLSFGSNLPGNEYNTISNYVYTSETGQRRISPYLGVYDYYGDTFVWVNKSYPDLTVNVVPDETIASVRLEAPAVLEIEKNYQYDLRDYVKAYILYTDGTEEELTDKTQIQFYGAYQNGGSTTGYYCNLSEYGSYINYTISCAGESVQMKVRCKRLYTYRVVADENIELARADRAVTAADLGLIVGWFNPDGIMADITDEVVLTGDTDLSTVGRHDVTIRFYEDKEIDLGWRTVGTVTFNVVCDSHSLGFVEAVPGTNCEHAGTIAYYECAVCGKRFSDAEGTQAITDITGAYGAHSYGDWVSEVAATCSATGTKGHYTCAVCRKNFDADKNEIADLTIQKDMSNHVGSTELRNQKAATCKEDGYTGDLCCTACNNVITAGETISKATVAHNGKKTAAKNATCEAAGNKEYYTCTVCGKLFSDAACTQETNTAGVTIPARGHAYGAWTTVRKASCSQEGWEERVCANDAGHKEGRPIGKTAHVDDGNGYCKNCGADLKGSQRCKCGQIHTGPFAWLIKFFHGIRYFFTHMFKK